jgi:hypothetical protein
MIGYMVIGHTRYGHLCSLHVLCNRRHSSLISLIEDDIQSAAQLPTQVFNWLIRYPTKPGKGH